MLYALANVVFWIGLLACIVGLFARLPLFLNRRTMALLVGVVWLFGGANLVPSLEPPERKAQREKLEAAEQAVEAAEAAKPRELELTSHKIAAGCGGPCLSITGTITNPTDHKRKDPIIKCTYFAESGTVVGVHREKLYKVVPAGKQVAFKELDLGIKPDQARTSSCEILASTRVG